MYFLKFTDTAPRAPITRGTTTPFRICQTFAISSFNSWYSSTFSSSLPSTPSSHGMKTSAMTTSLSVLSVKPISGLLSSIFRLHYTVKSHSILKFSLSTTLSDFCSYQLLGLSNPHLPQICQWTYRATLLCLPLYSVCAGYRLTHHIGHFYSFTSAHSTQKGFCRVINVKSHIICSQKLFLGGTY